MSDDPHVSSNPWQAWLESRRNWKRWQYMHLRFGPYGNDQACRGCALIKPAEYWQDHVKRYRDDCTMSDRGRHWDLNYPACGLFRKQEPK